jgi:hypothetical protein
VARIIASMVLDFVKTNAGARGPFVKQKLVLTSSFRCDLIHNCHRYDFGHTSLCYLSKSYADKVGLLNQ